MYLQKLIGKILSFGMGLMAILAVIFKEIYIFRLGFALFIVLICIWGFLDSKRNQKSSLLKNVFYIVFPIVSIYYILS